MTLTEFLLARIAEDEAFFRTYDIEESHRTRVLAECEAKRRIALLHDLDPDQRLEPECGEVERNWPCLTLRLLSLPHADHPDYQQEWRP